MISLAPKYNLVAFRLQYLLGHFQSTTLKLPHIGQLSYYCNHSALQLPKDCVPFLDWPDFSL
eukprot:3420257-Karenia_brevis.AAC.1